MCHKDLKAAGSVHQYVARIILAAFAATHAGSNACFESDLSHMALTARGGEEEKKERKILYIFLCKVCVHSGVLCVNSLKIRSQ